MPRVAQGYVAAGIGKRLKQSRDLQGLSQRELARLTNHKMTAAYISRIEAGARKPTLDAVWTFADALGIDREWLRTGTDMPSNDPQVSALRRRVRELEAQLAKVRKIVVPA